METKLTGIAEIAKKDPKVKFTSLVHLLNEESLKQCHFELPNNKASCKPNYKGRIRGKSRREYFKSCNTHENISGACHSTNYLVSHIVSQVFF